MAAMSARMIATLRLLNARRYAMTPTEVGIALGTSAGSVTGTLSGLLARGFATLAPRRDALSGLAYEITKAGTAEARRLATESSKPEARPGARCAYARSGRCDGPLYVALNGSGICACESHVRSRQSRGTTFVFRLARS